MQRLVSIIMPAYNADRHVSESIRSVLAQSIGDWELVVVDDGSTDKTRESVEKFVAGDKRIRYLARPNGGQAAARNTGLAAARGEVIAFLDADDLWLPEKLELQLDVLKRTNVDLVYTDGYIFSDGDAQWPDELFNILPGEAQGAEMFRILFAGNRIATLSVLVKKNVLDAAGNFDEDRAFQNCEDYDLWIRLAKKGARFFGMSEKLTRYRRHPGATTYTPSKLLAPMLAVILKHARDPLLEPALVKRRVRGLYRDLISSLVAEGRITEARQRMRDFAAWDHRALVTALQRLVLRSFPRGYNYISREFLYRAEWHVHGLFGKPRGA
jgi:teichuronic acid biosynthesis glycosyltransferase TuaG